MSYIPAGARWYVAEIVEEIGVQGAAEKAIHRNLILIEAGSPEEAYERAVDLGRHGESSYCNPEGRNVVAHFVGVSELSVVHDELEHGAELLYSEEIVGVDESASRSIPPKSELSVFKEARRLPERLDYSDRNVLERAVELD